MKPFDKYSSYYNAIYKNKAYEEETFYINHLIKKFSPIEVEQVLELGCGTGGHARELLNYGYSVHGVDMSPGMIELAGEVNVKNNLFTCEQADIRELELNKKFDCILSLFHVMSYQVENTDFLNALRSARRHLKYEGLLIFDFWYGPGVLSDNPVIKERNFESDEVKIKRMTTPMINFNENIVDVKFDIEIRGKENGVTENLMELHRMRYFFLPEIKLFLELAKFEFTVAYSWLKEEIPSQKSWYVTIVAKAC